MGSSNQYQATQLLARFKPAMLYACLLSAAIVLPGCASSPSRSKVESTVASTPENAATANEAQGELSAEFVYKYLIAEVAGQRGDFATSGSIFYDLAKETSDPRLAERAARTAAYGQIGNLAIPAVKLWSTLDPASTEAQQAMTEMLISTGQLKDAEPYLAKLLSNPETRAGGFLYLNALLGRSPDKANVLTLIQSLAKPYPSMPEAHFAVAQAAWAANKDLIALEALNKAETLRPGWSIAALLKGQVLFNQSPQAAIEFYQSYLERHPETTEVRVNLAKLLVSQKQFAAAKTQFPIILQYAESTQAKNLPEIITVVGLLAYQSGDYAAAETYFQQALKADFKEPDQIYIYLAQVAEKQERHEVAANWYNKVTPGPRYLEAQLNLANLIARTQNVDAAIAKLDALEDLTTEQQVIVIQTEAAMLARAKRNQDSFDLLEKAVKNMPNTPELVYDYALAAERVKKLDLMESELRKVIAAKPDFAAAYNALGYSFADRNIKLDEAQQLIEKALSLSPNDHYMLDSLGWVYYRKGNLDKAITYLQKAYNMNPDPEIAAHLGEVLWQKGQHEEAKKIWREALIANPDNEVLLIAANKFKS
jgi:tetratricopeptide (TPR) repeat protein